jgi:hypothetical protein
MKNKTPTPFDNSSFSVDSLNVDSQEDRVALYGNLDVTKDKEGLTKAVALANYFTEMVALLTALDKANKLEAKLTIESPVMKANPMGS